ncbi:MAG: DNA gyrase inhibitor YacG [Rhodobacteraceae bacterium]|nr:DNA gyrase inhibitor YacG [Paracoccaceae bacterium]
MTCPICRKETDRKYKPFCSRRCADVDLGRWLTGSYAIPVTEEEVQDDTLEDDGEENSTGPH